jgi:hypothetical protein
MKRVMGGQIVRRRRRSRRTTRAEQREPGSCLVQALVQAAAEVNVPESPREVGAYDGLPIALERHRLLVVSGRHQRYDENGKRAANLSSLPYW